VIKLGASFGLNLLEQSIVQFARLRA